MTKFHFHLFGKFEVILTCGAIIFAAYVLLFLSGPKTTPKTQIPLKSLNSPIFPSPSPVWPTYIDQVVGYSFKYPSSFSIESNKNFINLSSPNRNQIQIYFTPDLSATITDYLAKSDRISLTAFEGQPGKTIESTKKTKINDFNVIEREEYLIAADITATVTYFKIGNYFISVSLIAPPGNDKNSDLDTYHQILSTIHLL